jgi:hypothetical protein
MTRSLTEIANYYGTDKGTVGPSSDWGAHNYTDIYEAYLERFRRSPINLLEIGLGVTGEHWDARIVHGRNTGGASMRMWYDYFQNARIYGIDINECSYLDNDRCKTFVADQGKVEDLDAFMNATGGIEFDAIIDDGSHRPDHQQISLGYFFRKLKSGGLYFIEDLMRNGFEDGVAGQMACETARNTRSVLKYFNQNGSFHKPNTLINRDYLIEHIESICFHVPYVGSKYVLKFDFQNPLRKIFYHEPDSESLCVLRKK